MTIDLGFLPWHEGPAAACVAMPLGGIGTGTVAIGGDGTLRQWQLTGPGNHDGFVPDGFFALRSSRPRAADVFRVLEVARPGPDPSAPLTTDGAIPDGIRQRHAVLEPFRSSRIRAGYPVAEVELVDPEAPVQVTLRAFNPLVPLQVEVSSLPVAMFEVTLHNPGREVLTGWLGASLQNLVGWDGVAPIRGNRSLTYGGAVNRVRRSPNSTAIVMGNAALRSDAAGYGQVVLGADAEAAVLEQYASTDEFRAFLRGCYLIDHATRPVDAAEVRSMDVGGAAGPSPSGSTWSGGLAVPYRLNPGEEVTLRFWLAWWFPNRQLDFVQFRDVRRDRHPPWLGSHYSQAFPDAVAVSDLVARRWDELRDATAAWLDTARGLEPIDAEHLLAQVVPLRSPSCFRLPDGSFHGFEGVQGASTGSWSDRGGSCPLDCTHVWNYEQTLSRMFPSLERGMRDTEFGFMQAADGSIAHRVRLPLRPNQPSGPIGGPDAPALDGMLGTFLKCLREVQQGAGVDWLRGKWDALGMLMAHIRVTWEADDGLLAGPQPSTFDIPLHGINPYIGGLWLAALRAHARLAALVGDSAAADAADELWGSASAAYDRALFNGEYFEQRLDRGDPVEGSWGSGCLTDQLLGQWWAHQLGLGHILPSEHVRAALGSIVRYNFLRSFEGIRTTGRRFADQDDSGVLNCTWPSGGRPEHPVWYCDEVWSGSELQLAAQLAFEGMDDESRLIRQAVWRRHDGRRRNPFNHVECGDHYVRSMSGFALLEALSGVRHDAPAGGLIDLGGPDGCFPSVGAGIWGVVTREAGRLRFERSSLRSGAGELL